MTLETAKRIVAEGQPNKEAEAVVRRGMNICEMQADGSRKYRWIKVTPTKTEAESSIDKAMAPYQRKQKEAKASQTKETPIVEKVTVISTHPIVETKKDERYRDSIEGLINYMKDKKDEVFRFLDSLVTERI